MLLLSSCGEINAFDKNRFSESHTLLLEFSSYCRFFLVLFGYHSGHELSTKIY